VTLCGHVLFYVTRVDEINNAFNVLSFIVDKVEGNCLVDTRLNPGHCKTLPVFAYCLFIWHGTHEWRRILSISSEKAVKEYFLRVSLRLVGGAKQPGLDPSGTTVTDVPVHYGSQPIEGLGTLRVTTGMLPAAIDGTLPPLPTLGNAVQPHGKKGNFSDSVGSAGYCFANAVSKTATWGGPLEVVVITPVFKNFKYKVDARQYHSIVCLFIWNGKPTWRSTPCLTTVGNLKDYFWLVEGVPSVAQRISVNGRALTCGEVSLTDNDVVRMSVSILGGMVRLPGDSPPLDRGKDSPSSVGSNRWVDVNEGISSFFHLLDGLGEGPDDDVLETFSMDTGTWCPLPDVEASTLVDQLRTIPTPDFWPPISVRAVLPEHANYFSYIATSFGGKGVVVKKFIKKGLPGSTARSGRH